MTTDKELAKILMPLIRKIVPAQIAAEMVGVQPMYGPLDNVLHIETGETYKNDAVLYSRAGDEVEYYWVALRFNYLHIDRVKLEELLAWCHATYGKENADDGWHYSDHKIFFTDPAHRTVFLLRWG